MDPSRNVPLPYSSGSSNADLSRLLLSPQILDPTMYQTHPPYPRLQDPAVRSRYWLNVPPPVNNGLQSTSQAHWRPPGQTTAQGNYLMNRSNGRNGFPHSTPSVSQFSDLSNSVNPSTVHVNKTWQYDKTCENSTANVQQKQSIIEGVKNTENAKGNARVYKPEIESSKSYSTERKHTTWQNYGNKYNFDEAKSRKVYHDRNNNEVPYTMEAKRYHPYATESHPIIADSWSQKESNSNRNNHNKTEYRYNEVNINGRDSATPVPCRNDGRERKQELRVSSGECITNNSYNRKQQSRSNSKECNTTNLRPGPASRANTIQRFPNLDTSVPYGTGDCSSRKQESSVCSRKSPTIDLKEGLNSRNEESRVSGKISGNWYSRNHVSAIMDLPTSVAPGINGWYNTKEKSRINDKQRRTLSLRDTEHWGVGSTGKDGPYGTFHKNDNCDQREKEFRVERQSSTSPVDGHDISNQHKNNISHNDYTTASPNKFSGGILVKRTCETLPGAADHYDRSRKLEIDNNNNASEINGNDNSCYPQDKSDTNGSSYSNGTNGDMFMDDKNPDELLLSMTNRRIKINRLLEEQKRLMQNLHKIKNSAPQNKLDNYGEEHTPR